LIAERVVPDAWRNKAQQQMFRQLIFALAVPMVAMSAAFAGPPYFSDDPEPTDYRHFEIYLFDNGAVRRDGDGGTVGIDFNYGAAPDLQLTAVLPLGYDSPAGGGTATGLGNIELAAKYKILHQEGFGWDVAVFPRVFLPSGSPSIGARHASLLLPIWLGKDWGRWSTFGGGGCVINHGEDSQNFCLAGWALTRQVLPDLQIGAELYRQTADTRGGRATTGIGGGVRYDLNDHYHLLGYIGPRLQNPNETIRYSWYIALLSTF
jgi:hypothetical protein